MKFLENSKSPLKLANLSLNQDFKVSKF